MIRQFLLFLSFLCPLFAGFCQDQVISVDSLEKIRLTCENDFDNYEYADGIKEAMILLSLAESANNSLYTYHAHNNLGIAFEELRDSARAHRHYKKALENATKIKNDTLILWAYNNLGNIYSQSESDYVTGIDYYLKAIKLANELNIPYEVITPTVNIAWTYLDLEQPEKAKVYLDKGKKYLKMNRDKTIVPQLDMLYGEYYSQKNEIDSSIYYFEKSTALIDKDSMYFEGTIAYKEYANVFFKTNDYKRAYIALKKYNQYRDKVFEKEKNKEIEAAKAKFDINKFEKNLALANQEKKYQEKIISKSREKLIFICVAVFVLIIVLVFLNQINRSRLKLIKELKLRNTQLSAAKEKAEHLSNLKTEFFSTVSHELRTPLYGVIGLTSLLLKDESLKGHRKDLNSLKFSADYLLALINDVLELNKMGSKLVELENVSFHLRELLEGIIKALEFTRIQNSNKIFLDIEEDIPEAIIGDSVRLSQILVNLIGNALKFTSDGNIWIRVKLDKVENPYYTICFEVEDDGVGIPKNKQKKIFEEFSQLKSSNTSYQGTGLGLSIVKKMLELFDSEIHLESDEGKGAKFFFSIKFKRGIVIKSNNEEVDYSSSIYKKKNKSNIRILIVDDNRINQVVTRRILEQNGYTCQIAQNGEQAIQITKEKAFDLILMDLNMPGISGFDASREIRKFNSKIPIVALTAVEVSEVKEDVEEAGMNDIVVKPYDIEQFYKIISKNLIL
ncbi:response regulator [Zunongwangia sp.]|uniref:tetratricopeptide repeat-containing hybrid sensor histidine kinase/response regulator n=1 Tax=Zunongwangia sp. TaxID=1965325 RepID=UPI003AA9D538